ncbi:Holliday junction resolvase RuvX [Lactobacillus hamsteri]|uniref:Putative pre-16S rRNA nuclease n=1 Tax=Lactobacillus hamsteri DSM 5661 = JCM 6256 TaxID=1423754 RepID=A0A0R1YEK3_9LACO|nr:Holliday junction resolvase RuvX [Lactobacillus hamsteri]KRM40437.1 crossover junction endodeoxyribonuclease [Lactobacillus hamsteri DSM 5661 = JCM 6256]
MKRLIGLDIGSKTVGVAVSDELGISAQRLETITIDEDRHNFGIKSLKKIVREYDPEAFVLGLPKNMDGTSGHSVERSKAYGKRLEDKFGLPVYYDDERLTTIESRRVLVEEAGMHDRKKRKEIIDQMAAVLILQNYLDLHRKD